MAPPPQAGCSEIGSWGKVDGIHADARMSVIYEDKGEGVVLNMVAFPRENNGEIKPASRGFFPPTKRCQSKGQPAVLCRLAAPQGTSSNRESR
jgi:hypothetical protein